VRMLKCCIKDSVVQTASRSASRSETIVMERTVGVSGHSILVEDSGGAAAVAQKEFSDFLAQQLTDLHKLVVAMHAKNSPLTDATHEGSQDSKARLQVHPTWNHGKQDRHPGDNALASAPYEPSTSQKLQQAQRAQEPNPPAITVASNGTEEVAPGPPTSTVASISGQGNGSFVGDAIPLPAASANPAHKQELVATNQPPRQRSRLRSFFKKATSGHHTKEKLGLEKENLSRQATRIDDFDDIVREGYKGLRKKRSGCTDDDEEVVESVIDWRRRIHHLVLEPAICIVLVINAFLIGVNLDVHRDWEGWNYVDMLFIAIYLGELLLKIHLLGWADFIERQNRFFNFFDVVIIIIAMIGAVLQFMQSGEVHHSIVVVRLVRLARVARIVRLFRFEIFKELLVMIACLISGLRTLMWAFVLLFFAVYPMSLVLTQFIGHVEEDQYMKELFETVPRSMLTVFRCVIGDCNYSNGTPAVLDLVDRYGMLWIPMYVTVMLIITFGLFNLIMAIFVDNALTDAKRQERAEKLRRLKDRALQKEATAKLLELLWGYVLEEQAAQNKDNNANAVDGLASAGIQQMRNVSVTKGVFQTFLSDREVIQNLERLDVPEEERLDLFDVLDANGNGSIQMDELINGVIKLRGDPRRSDIIHVLLVLRSLQEEMQDFRDFVHGVHGGGQSPMPRTSEMLPRLS